MSLPQGDTRVEATRPSWTCPGGSLLAPSRNNTSGEPRRIADLRLRARAQAACLRWLGALLRPRRRASAAAGSYTLESRLQLRVVALTDLGATAAFSPISESMAFGRPLAANEHLLVCLIQLIEPGRALPVATVQVTPELLGTALRQLDWHRAASAAAEGGLEHALRAQLRGIRRPALRPPHRFECHYRCSCGSDWSGLRAQTDEDRCPVCHTPCFPQRTAEGGHFADAGTVFSPADVLALG